jgi:choline dehydrogenase-like flavoprotein
MYMDKIAETEPLTGLEKVQGFYKELVLSIYNVSGSCAMMPREDRGVVNSHLRVYGSANIRVFDASIFPLVPRGNIQAADIIKQNLN